MPETQNIEYKSVWKDEFSCKVSAWIFRSILTPNSGHIDPQKN